MAKQRPTLRTLEPNREETMDGQNKARLLPIGDLKLEETYASLFSMDADVLAEITASMQKDGYDQARPIVVNSQLVVIEGHTRLQAAKHAGLTYVPVYIRAFASETEALYYALREQTSRRNLTPHELLNAIEKLDKIYGEGKAQDGAGRRLDRMAKELGVGASTIAKARYVQKHLPELGDNPPPLSSINATYKELKAKEKGQKSAEDALDEAQHFLAPNATASSEYELIYHEEMDSYAFYHEGICLIELHASESYNRDQILLLLMKSFKK
ncbi:ParB/RepB/Spo0J family partition protein [Entomospira culicis]|uniref:ParB/RepB/Spo0J family partition protein n=1 Tax=Entomospira culicis TaxID=2719989 RepID=A0A968GJL5_9SPIO|nr:ParB/RepB/Spo0J family partition protein [Entomospira culicis]NIZ19904.1 ParB/RepB/Spo0J family partition protein [Entomospira culicis]NIZ70139.1 ParB/RepB/Spo0J family partition protein [Entomospira culicis]WDI38066.1 ParB/RepB/Spo0J family partition protein [Entomospira culicis]WDI39689.1 ParB/RepB/Spo0J family partition protein [Entomospira culicis]